MHGCRWTFPPAKEPTSHSRFSLIPLISVRLIGIQNANISSPRQIPVELLGAAQTIWNYAKVMADKHEKGELDGIQRWRSQRALERACTAWNELLTFLKQPVDFGGLSLDVVQTQEAAMMREMTIIGLLHKVHTSLPHQFSISLVSPSDKDKSADPRTSIR